MKCFNCNNDVSIKTAFCTNCGVNLKKTINLTISSPGKYMGFAIKLKIYVNDEEVLIGAGETINLNMPVGPCNIRYKFWCRREKNVTIYVVPDKTYSVVFKYDPIWGGFKISKKDSVLD